MMLPVNTIEINEQGKVSFNLASMASNDDWLAAWRLLKDDKKRKFAKVDNIQMYYKTE